MRSFFCKVDDKHIPLFRVMWPSAVAHFCGQEDYVREGQYEIRLEQGESVWASRQEQDEMLLALEHWQGGIRPNDDWE